MSKLSKKELNQLIQELIKELEAKFKDNFTGLVLFGSYARETQKEHSDVDLLILFEDKINDPLEIIIDKIIDLELKFRTSISPIFSFEKTISKSILTLEICDYSRIILDKNKKLNSLFKEIKREYSLGHVKKFFRENYHVLNFENV